MLLTSVALIDAVFSAQILVSAFLAILFLQSGIDKITDRKGNLEWLTGHFSTSPLKGQVPMMLTTVTILEIAAGLAAAAGAVMLLVNGSTTIALIGAQLSALNLVMLFFGQRIAKDYVGAATLVSYFILTVLAILLYGGVWG